MKFDVLLKKFIFAVIHWKSKAACDSEDLCSDTSILVQKSAVLPKEFNLPPS